MDIDDLAALRLQIEWGADDALLDTPIDRFAAAPARAISAPLRVEVAASRTAAEVAASRTAAEVTASRTAAEVTASRTAPAPLAAGPALAVKVAAAATDLASLHAALDAFDTSPLRATATTTVAPSGNPEAGLVLIGEAPGPDDDRAGRAFSGPAGDRLDRVLRSAGLGRNDLLLALVVPWRPPGGRPVNEAELALCLPFLHRVLALAQPRRLVLMGVGPYRALTGDNTGFRKARGKWMQTAIPGIDPPIPTLTTLAPDIWLGSATNKQAIWADLLALRALLAAA